MTKEDFKEEWTEQEFKNHVWDRIGRTDKTYPKWILAEFCEHWIEKPGGRAKMKWQLKGWNKSGKFIISMRLASWKSNSMEWHPKKWKAKDTPMKPVKWLPTNTSPEAKEASKKIKEGYKKLIKEAETKPRREGITLVAQQMINVGRPAIKKQEAETEKKAAEYKKYKEEYLNKRTL